MSTTAYTVVDSPIGEILLTAEDGALTRLYMSPFHLDSAWEPDPDALAEPVRQLAEYFAGERRDFDLRLAPEGTPFERSVWEELRRIPFGETRSYGEIAQAIGRPGAARAVGRANGANPIPIVVPCHRVIGSDGSLTGFGGGLEAKSRLLEIEGRRLPF